MSANWGASARIPRHWGAISTRVRPGAHAIPGGSLSFLRHVYFSTSFELRPARLIADGSWFRLSGRRRPPQFRSSAFPKKTDCFEGICPHERHCLPCGLWRHMISLVEWKANPARKLVEWRRIPPRRRSPPPHTGPRGSLVGTFGAPPPISNSGNSGQSDVGSKGVAAHCRAPSKTWTRHARRVGERCFTSTERRYFREQGQRMARPLTVSSFRIVFPRYSSGRGPPDSVNRRGGGGPSTWR